MIDFRPNDSLKPIFMQIHVRKIFRLLGKINTMATIKTQENEVDPNSFLEQLDDKEQAHEARQLLELFEKASAAKPKMWGDSIIGFGKYRLRYKTGREIDWMLCGFSPRKGKMSLYIMDGADRYTKLLEDLGKHKTGKSCLYIKSLNDINMDVLFNLVKTSCDNIKRAHP